MSTDARKDLNPYFEQKPEHLQKTTIKPMEIILRSHPDMGAEMRWGKPTKENWKELNKKE
jgi:hypothetical protein